MSKKRKDPKPNETDSSSVDSVSHGNLEKTEPRVTSNETGTATGSHKGPPAEDVTSKLDNAAEEYILKRESDGRYQIVGRRPRKPR